MKKGFKTAVIAAALVLTLAACGSKGASTDRSYYLDGGSSYEDAGVSASKGLNYAPDHAMEVTASDSQAQYYSKDGSLTTTSSQMRENTKIIYTAYMQLQSTEFDETVETLEQMVFSIGGYFEKQNLNNGSYYSSKSVRLRNASFTVRVPSEKFSEFLSSVGDKCHVVSVTQSSEDVGEQYFDTEQRLETLKNKHARLEELLLKAEKMADIISLEDALSDTEYEINRLTSTLNRYDSLIGFSTINIELNEVERTDISVTEDPGFFERLGKNFKNGFADFGETLDDLAMWASYNIMGIIIFVVIIVVLVKVKPFARLRKRLGTRSDRKAAKAAEKAGNAE